MRSGLMSNMGRSMSVASNFHRQFEEAYAKKMELQAKVPPNRPDIVNKAEYGTNYYNADRLANMKVGYVHPYHSDGSPIYLSNAYYMRQLFQAVGPE
jgi:hypothetical protein